MDLASTIDMKALGNISRINVRNETLMLLLNLYESKGKTFYYNELFKKDYEALSNLTLEEDIVEVAKMLNLDLTEARIRLCSKRDYSPKNKDEQLLYNIKKILERIQSYHYEFEVLPNEADELSKRLAKDFEPINWNQRQRDDQYEGLIKTNKFVSKREDLDTLVKLYNKTVKSNKYELTHIVTNFYVDFVNMDIFDNLNELIALIFIYTIIFKNFTIFSYVSFFKHFNNIKEQWNLGLVQASYNWNTAYPKTDTLSDLLFQLLINAYEDIDTQAHQYEFEKDLNKSDSVENTILKFDKLFSKEEIRQAHPTVSDSTINRTLARLRDEAKILPIGTGRSAKWQVLKPITTSKFSQQSLF